MEFSVLMSVYDKERPEFLRAALDSIWTHQTLPPSEIILVKDGLLTPELDEIILHFQSIAPLKIYQIEQNVGLGTALKIGLKICTNEIVARMDSDDISCHDRFEKQIRLLTEKPHLDIAGTYIAEFHDHTDNICSRRHLPVTYQAIQKFAKIRNPLNHMTVIFKKSAIIDAGNYLPFHGYEDYYLWVRMLQNSSHFENLPEELVFARVGNNMYARRQGMQFFLQELRLQKEFLKMNFLNYWEYSRNIILRALPRLFPVSGLKLVYKYLRK